MSDNQQAETANAVTAEAPGQAPEAVTNTPPAQAQAVNPGVQAGAKTGEDPRLAQLERAEAEIRQLNELVQFLSEEDEPEEEAKPETSAPQETAERATEDAEPKQALPGKPEADPEITKALDEIRAFKEERELEVQTQRHTIALERAMLEAEKNRGFTVKDQMDALDLMQKKGLPVEDAIDLVEARKIKQKSAESLLTESRPQRKESGKGTGDPWDDAWARAAESL